MVNYETIRLENGMLAVEAKYIETGIEEYNNNPMIEALPPINERTDVAKLLYKYPKINTEIRNSSKVLRIHSLQSIFELFQPLCDHLELEQNISIIIRQGYIDRDPLSKTYAQDSKTIHESVKDKNFNLTNKLLRRPGQGFTIIGLSGTGKSTGINNVISLYPQIIVHSKYKDKLLSTKQLVWIKLDCPSKGSIKDLCIFFFKEIDALLGTNYEKQYVLPNKYSSEVFKCAMVKVANACNLGLLIIDEIQNLSAAASGGYESMLNFFTTLRNELGLPVILVGTRKSYDLFKRELSQARRASGYGSILWSGAQKDDMWNIFVDKLLEYQVTDKVYDDKKGLISKALYEESQGIIDIAMKIFVICQVECIVKGKYKHITPKLIKDVSKEKFYQVKPMIEAIKSKNIEKMAKFDDILPYDIDNFFKETLDREKRKKDIEAFEEVKKNYKINKEKDIKDSAKSKVLELGYKSKEINKYLNKIFMKNPNIDENKLANLIIREIILNEENNIEKGDNKRVSKNELIQADDIKI